MEPLLSYLIKSTICISVLYLVFRWTLKKENLFALSRFLLIAILIFSIVVPIVKLPTLFDQTINIKVLPENKLVSIPDMDDVAMQITSAPVTEYTAVSTERSISIKQFTSAIYALGVLSLLIVLLVAIAKIGLLLARTKIYRKKHYKLALVNETISPMSIGKYIIMSRQDYKEHRKEIVLHELAHIKFKHTYDLLLVELVKLFHWFNPFVYALRNDLKEIQEFQVDRHLVGNGTNLKEYQLLLIRKCVGEERYALANSFNHCQIKNRIVMMNTTRNKKTNTWKLLIFLPFILIMLFAFTKANKNTDENNSQTQKVSETPSFSIEGAWTYVLSQQVKNGKTYTLINEGSKYNEMKMWTKEHFTFVGNQGMGGYPFGGSGKYKLQGNYYQEIVNTAPLKVGSEPEVFKMKMEMKNDTLIQIWPTDEKGKYDPNNYNIIKMVPKD